MSDTPEDVERERFLMRLSRSNLRLTAWESEFVDNVLLCAQETYFTPRIREKIDQVRKRYEKDL